MNQNKITKNLVRWSSSSKPTTGGVALFLTVLPLLIYVNFNYSNNIATVLCLGCILSFLIGWFDDIISLKAYSKFFGQFICACLPVYFGIVIHASPIAILNQFLTIVWIVGIMNSINMIDNMDAIAGSLSFVILSNIFLISFFTNFVDISNNIVLFGFLIALIVFLYYNWHPSKIYMGDSGSQLLGFVLAFFGIIYLWSFRDFDARGFQAKQWVLPLIVYLIPFIDTATVIYRRTLRGQKFWIGGKDHTTHHLAYLGFNDKQVAKIIIFLSLLCLVVSIVFINLLPIWKYWYMLLFFLYIVIFFLAIQAIYVRASFINEQKQGVK